MFATYSACDLNTFNETYTVNLTKSNWFEIFELTNRFVELKGHSIYTPGRQQVLTSKLQVYAIEKKNSFQFVFSKFYYIFAICNTQVVFQYILILLFYILQPYDANFKTEFEKFSA